MDKRLVLITLKQLCSLGIPVNNKQLRILYVPVLKGKTTVSPNQSTRSSHTHTLTSKLSAETKDGSLAHGLLHAHSGAEQIVTTNKQLCKFSIFVSPTTKLILSVPMELITHKTINYQTYINPLSPELNSICYLLALLGAHYFLHVSRIRVKSLTFRRLMSYIYIWSTHS